MKNLVVSNLNPNAMRDALRALVANGIPEDSGAVKGGEWSIPIHDEKGNVVRYGFVSTGLRGTEYTDGTFAEAQTAYAEKQAARKEATARSPLNADADRALLMSDPLTAKVMNAMKGVDEAHAMNAVQVAETVSGVAVALVRPVLTALVEEGIAAKVKGKPGQMTTYYLV